MFIGIEIGGTKLQLGLGPGDGTLAALWRGSVDVQRGGEGIREQILQQVPLLLECAGLPQSQVKGIGVGFGGPVDDADQTVIKSHQIEGWDGFPLAKWLGELLALPVALGNDADVAALAEALVGAGKGLSPIFYITIGSGIGGGLIINGEIYRGSGRGAAEIGHLRRPYLEINTIKFATLESKASGWGLAAGWGTAEAVADAAKAGDSAAINALQSAWADLAEGICQVIALLSPSRIVIGGGVSGIGEKLLFAPLRKLVAERVFQPFADCYDIMPAALGEEVVVHGALALARKRLGG